MRLQQWQRQARARFIPWLLAALVVFIASDFVLRVPAMQFAMPQHSLSTHQAHTRKSSNQPKPASHDHSRCQLCVAPPLAVAATDWAQLGRSRLVILEQVIMLETVLIEFEHVGFVASRAPPA